MVWCIFAPIPLHTLLHNNPNMFNFSPEQRKKIISLSQNVRLGVLMTSSWACIFPFFRFLSIHLSCPSLHLSSTYLWVHLSIYNHLFIYRISIWLYITLCGSLGSISSLSLSLSLALSLSLSFSLQNLATCTTCRSQFCTSQTAASRAHTGYIYIYLCVCVCVCTSIKTILFRETGYWSAVFVACLRC